MKMLVVGLDGASWDIIRPLMKAGKLPNLERFTQSGAFGVLESVTPPISPPAWASFLTGKNPGKHGVYNFVKAAKDHPLKQVPCSFQDIGCDTFPALFSDKGMSVGLLNIPLTYPPPQINGFVIPGIPTPPDNENICFPDSINDTVRDAVRGYQVDRDFSDYLDNAKGVADNLDKYRRLFEDLVSIEERRLQLARHLLVHHPVDVFVVVFTLLDRLQHFYWKFADPNHPGYTEEGAAALGDAIASGYEKIDRMLGSLTSGLDERIPVMVMSDHGSGPFHGDFLLNRWLRDNGYLKLRSRFRPILKRTTVDRLLARLKLGALASVFPPAVRQMPLRIPYLKTRYDADDVVWSKTRAYASTYGLRVNVRGREPSGIVEDGEAREMLICELSARLGQLHDIVGNIDCHPTKELYSGPFAEMAPDVYLNIADITVLVTENLNGKTWYDRTSALLRSGTHRIEGIFLAKGEMFARGKEVTGLSIIDLAPTIFHVLGLPVPADMDGRVALETLDEEYVRSNPVVIDETLRNREAESAQRAYSDADEMDIIKSLRGLGYID